MKEEMGVPKAIVRVLEEAGIDLVFGMPGGNTGKIYDALRYSSTIRTVLVRHESLAGVMAEVYGRLTGKPGVVIGQGAFLLANAALGVLEAHLGSSPMLLLSDLTDGAPLSQHGPYQNGTGEYGGWDARMTFSGFTKRTFVPMHPAQAVQDTQLGIKHALSGQRGPVIVLYHSDALSGRVGPHTFPRLYATEKYIWQGRQWADAQVLRDAARVLSKADRPVIIAGNGVRISRAYSELQALAELLAAPVTTTASGKGVFPETHQLALGVFGTFGLPAANAVVQAADVILAVGTKLSPTDTANENPQLLDPERQTLIQIDVEALNSGWTFPADHALIGDAKVVFEQLTAAIQSFTPPDLAQRRLTASAAHIAHRSFEVPESTSDEVPVLPQRIIKDLSEAIPAEGIVTCDAGENRLFMNHYFRTKAAGTFLQPASIGGMGYAIPAALGVKLLFPERAVVAVCGDGGFSMAMNGLITAVEEGIPIIVVVFNNSALGWVLHGHGPFAATFHDFNYAKIAEAIGCVGIRVEEPKDLRPALTTALASDRLVVVDVVTSLTQSFQKVTSPLVRAPETAA
jgi:acetolactate synthase-1/2/3 large subunit